MVNKPKPIIIRERQKQQDNYKLKKQKQECPQIFKQEPMLLPFLIDNIKIISGEVKNPGIYLKKNQI